MLELPPHTPSTTPVRAGLYQSALSQPASRSASLATWRLSSCISPVASTVVGGIAKARGSISPIALHRDPSVYRDPTVLDPDRWLPGRAEEVPRNAYFVFGAGNRQCIGDRYAWTAVMLGLAAITPRWRLEPVAGHTVTEVAKVSVTPNALPLRLIPRTPIPNPRAASSG